jgi:nucleotide-binding universal stress UspA family protein
MQDILIHVRDFEKRTPAARFGARLAVKSGASVTGVYVCPNPLYIAPAFEPELMAAAIDNARELVKDAVQAKQSFLDWTRSLGVVHADWVVAEGPIPDALAQAATLHDLLVLDHAEGPKGSSWDIPGTILKARVPCIVLPQQAPDHDRFERVAIGWNGSPEAMRAVHSAMPFLEGRHALLLRGEERDRYPGVAWNPPFDIEGYLRRHNVTVVPHTIAARNDDAGASILAEAARFGAELLVTGAYGRSRFSEWILGGVTRHVLAWADIPVLLRH